MSFKAMKSLRNDDDPCRFIKWSSRLLNADEQRHVVKKFLNRNRNTLLDLFYAIRNHFNGGNSDGIRHEHQQQQQQQSWLESYRLKVNANSVVDDYLNYQDHLNYFHYFYSYQSNYVYNQSIIYYNNLILALITLFIIFTIVILLEDNDQYYNLSTVVFLLLVTFNLIVLIFAHNLAKQFLNSSNASNRNYYLLGF